jgi:hypothetical protein
MLRCRRLPASQRYRALAAITAAMVLTGILLGQLAIILSRSPFISSAADLSDMPPGVALTGRQPTLPLSGGTRGCIAVARHQKGDVERRAWTRRRQRIRLRGNDFCWSAVSAGEEFAVIGTESIGNLPL